MAVMEKVTNKSQSQHTMDERPDQLTKLANLEKGAIIPFDNGQD